MLKVWGRRNSFNVQKVMWLIGELGIEHEHIPAGGQFGGLDSAEFLKLNPHGHIPVISDDGVAAWESHTILRYLAAKQKCAPFWYDAPMLRAQSEQWMDWSQTSLQPDFLSGVFWAFYRTPENQRDWPAIHKSIQRCNKHFLLLNEILKDRRFILGDELTLADIPAGTSLYRYFELEIERPIIPHVEAWYQRLRERPAFCEHVMVPFDDMKGKLSY